MRNGLVRSMSWLAGLSISVVISAAVADETAAKGAPTESGLVKLIAHWPLKVDARDHVGNHHASTHGGVAFARVEGRIAADFNGRDGFLEVQHSSTLALGRDDFSIALWARPRRP